MFDPSELEGEVDHSFFDSDCDKSNISTNGKKKTEKCPSGSKDIQPAHERPSEEQPDDTEAGVSQGTGWESKQLETVEGNNSNRAEEQESICQSTDVERSRASITSSTESSASDEVDSDSEDNVSLWSKGADGTLLSLLARDREADLKNIYGQNPSETGEETFSSRVKRTGSKGRNKHYPNRQNRNRRSRSPSPTSTEASMHADSESSISSAKGRSLEPPALPRPSKSSISQGKSKTQISAEGSLDTPLHSTELEDTATDVSPLSSAYSSPRHTFDPKLTKGGLREIQQQEKSVPSSGLSNAHPDEESDQYNDECIFTSMSQLRGGLVYPHPGRRNRKNYSFTNDEVRCIDRENSRLLRELSRLTPGPRPGSIAGKKNHLTKNPPAVRHYHSAINRQRDQQRIERENLAFLKRLESVKPTPGLQRSQLLADYQKQLSYPGPSNPVFISAAEMERYTSKTPSGPRRVSSVHHSSTPVSTPTDLRPVARSKKTTTARPAWN